MKSFRKFLSRHIFRRDTDIFLLQNSLSSLRRASLVSSQNMRSTKFSKGFTLLIAIITTSMLLLVSFVVVNVALKQLVLANSNQESQHAFYAADSGIECAIFWDLKNGPASAFDITTPGTISCNTQRISTGSQTVPTSPSEPSLIGGGGPGNRTSIFSVNFTKGCAIARVTKNPDGSTTIDSRGYNTCDTSAIRRFERGVTLQY